MEKSPRYHPKLFESLRTEQWPGVFEAWKEGRHRDSLLKLLDSINPSLRKVYSNEQQTEFKIPHGPVLVNIFIKGNSVEISADYASTSGAWLQSLFRKVAELNFYPLHLAQIRVSEDLVRFHYSTSLDLCNPCKVYQVLKEICVTADRYESDFHEQLQAKKVFEPQLTHCTDHEIAQGYTAIQNIIQETLLLGEYLEKQDSPLHALAMLTLGLKRIEYFVEPQRFLKRQISEAYIEIAQQASTISRIDFLRRYLVNLQQVPIEQFKSWCCRSHIFIPDKRNLNLQGVNDHLKFFTPEQFMTEQNYIHAVTECLSAFYSLMYANYFDKTLYDDIRTTLAFASEKPWNEAAQILVSAFKRYKTTGSPADPIHRDFIVDCVCFGAPDQHLVNFKEGRPYYSQNLRNGQLLTPVEIFCEQALTDLGLNAAMCRDGNLSWKIKYRSVEGRLFVYQDDFLYVTASLNELPEENIELLNEIVSLNVAPLMLGLWQNELFVSYRVTLCDIFSTHAQEIRSNVSNLYHEANNLAGYFAGKYGRKSNV